MAGYSGTPLPTKLGIKPESQVLLRGAPTAVAASLGVPVKTRPGKGLFDVLVVFVKTRAALERAVADLRAHMKPAAGLWIAWPKKSSGVPTDVTEDTVRAVALPTGLVDNKVCAIDETWSGLRLVIRKELR